MTTIQDITLSAAKLGEKTILGGPVLLSKISGSLQALGEGLSDALALSKYGGSLWIGLVIMLLFLHFFLYNLENISSLPAVWKQTFDELRIYIQVTLVCNILYYGGVILGIMYGTSGTDATRFVYSLGFLTVAMLFINKFCLIFTGDNNPEYIKIASEPPLVNPAANQGQRYVYVWLSWIQTVTDIVVQKLVPGVFLGWAVGKAAAAVRADAAAVLKVA